MTDGFHTLRLAHLGPKNKDSQVIAEHQNVVHVWLDGVRLAHKKGNPLTQREGDSRLIIGDTTEVSMGDHLDIDFTHIAYDVDKVLAPIATPPDEDPAICPDLEALHLRALKRSSSRETYRLFEEIQRLSRPAD